MLAIIVIDHGSRLAKANQESEQLCEIIRSCRPGSTVVLAHLEFLGPTIADAVSECVRRGATEIAVLPYLLGSGRHAVDDVPRLAKQAAAQHRSVKITLGKALGPAQQIAEIMLRNAGL